MKPTADQWVQIDQLSAVAGFTGASAAWLAMRRQDDATAPELPAWKITREDAAKLIAWLRGRLSVGRKR